MLSIFIRIVFCQFNVYALSNDNKEIKYLPKDETVNIEKIIEENMNDGNIPGLSVTIVKDNKTV